MLDNLRKIIGGLAGDGRPARFGTDDRRVAAVALLIHVAAIDGVVHASERQRLLGLIEQKFALDAEDTRRLLAAAEKSEAEATDVQELVDLIRRQMDADEKARLVGLMWDIAYADGHLHEFEENLIARVAAMLGVDSDCGADRGGRPA